MGGIVIIGAGECGVRAAFALREAGYEGRVRLFGDERHWPYERPPLSKTMPPEMRPIVAPDRYLEAGIELSLDRRAVAIAAAERTVRFADGATAAFDQLLLATGARPRLFPGMTGVATLRSADDAASILGRFREGGHVAIIGGGFIGLELAATARRRGMRVSLIEAADRLMARAVPAMIAGIAEARHRAAGVTLFLGAAVARASESAVELADGRRIEADFVVAGTGALPNDELAAGAGLRVANGIVVDHAFRTSAPGIFAAGDCCAFPYRGSSVRLESWRVAQEQGAHAARAMLGSDDPYASVPWFWSDQYDLTLQVAGLADPTSAWIRRDLADGAVIVFQKDASGALVAASGIGPGTAVSRDIRLAEMLIARGASPDDGALVDPAVSLKALLRA